MASSIGSALCRIKDELDVFVPSAWIGEVCRQARYFWRDRKLPPARTVHLLLLQLLAGVSLAGLRRVAQIAASAQAIGKARMRLPVSVMIHLVEHVGTAVDEGAGCLWHGLRVILADGTCCLVEDTPQLAGKYGRARNQRGVSRSYPVPKLLALLDWSSGMIRKIIALPAHRGERSGLKRLFGDLTAGDLVMGDRGLVSFAHLALLAAAGLNGCFRLPRCLVVDPKGRAHGRRTCHLGRQDWLVCWTPAQRPAWMTKTEWGAMPAELVLRQIAVKLVRKGYRTTWSWVITTLTDPVAYPAQEIAELYERRWQVEVDFRDLKTSLRMRKLSAKTLAGVRKELLAFVLLYNLVRRIMVAAAQKQGVTPDRISFIDAARWLLWSSPGEALPTLVVNSKRRRPTEPRMVKRGRYRYARLNRPRALLRRPRHQPVVDRVAEA